MFILCTQNPFVIFESAKLCDFNWCVDKSNKKLFFWLSYIFFFSFLNRGWFYWFYKCKFHWEFEVWFQRRHILFCCFWCILPDGLWCIGWCKYERWPERTQSKYTRRLSSRSWFMVRICSYMNSLHNVFIFF